MRWLAILLLAATPALAEVPACPFPGQAPMLLVRLYFGQSVRGYGVASRRAWQDFVAGTITRALPGGFTVFDGSGQYLDKTLGKTGAIGREATEVVEVAAGDTAEFRGRIEAVAEAYRRRFRQGAVGIVSSAVCGVF